MKTPSPIATSTRRQIRLLILVDSARNAGLLPIPVLNIHVAAYFSNVLAPVWDLPPMDDMVMKRSGGPFYPELQHDLDRLVGRGLINVHDLRHVAVQQGGYRLECSYSLNQQAAMNVLEAIYAWPEEKQTSEYVQEIMLALSSLSDEQISQAFQQDPTYASNKTGGGNVIEFGEFSERNYSAPAAEKIGELLPTNSAAGPGEKIHLYMRHLRVRLAGGR